MLVHRRKLPREMKKGGSQNVILAHPRKETKLWELASRAAARREGRKWGR